MFWIFKDNSYYTESGVDGSFYTTRQALKNVTVWIFEEWDIGGPKNAKIQKFTKYVP